jgi:hypothetical protein
MVPNSFAIFFTTVRQGVYQVSRYSYQCFKKALQITNLGICRAFIVEIHLHMWLEPDPQSTKVGAGVYID